MVELVLLFHDGDDVLNFPL